MNNAEHFDVNPAIISQNLVVNGRQEKDLYPEHQFHTNNRLITVDAPDGSGKGAFAESLYRQLIEKFGEGNVVLVQPTRFELTEKGLKLLEKLKSQQGLKSNSVRHNLHFMATLMVNYQDVISKALDSGKIVVADSSEIRSLAFMFDRGTEATIQSTVRWIKSGTATNDLSAGNRVFINTSPEDCLANIFARGKVDYGDPTTPQEAQRRLDCYTLAIQVISGLKQDRPSNIIQVDNPRVEVLDIKGYIDHLVAQNIIPKLVL